MEDIIQIDLAASIALIGSSCYFVFYTFLYKKIIRPRNQLVNEAIKAIPKIEKMHSEFYKNGGSTVVDRLIRMEDALIKVSQVQHVYLLEHELGIYETDKDGECLRVNRTYCRMVGLTPEECYGSGWIQAIHPEDIEAVIYQWQQSVEGKRDFRFEYRMIHTDRTVLYVIGTAHPMKNSYSGELIGFLGTIKLQENG
jgi:PAS domain S-box-containing protein